MKAFSVGFSLPCSLLCLGLCFLFGCDENRCFTSYGPTEERVIHLPSFSTIVIRDDIEVRFVPDTLSYAVVSYGRNAFPFLHLSVSGETLTIENRIRCRWLRDYSFHPVVELHCPSWEIHGLIHESIYPFTVQDTFRTDSLFLEIKRSGDVFLLARIWFLVANLWDTGNLKLRGDCAIDVINLYSIGEFDGMNATLAYTYIYHYGLRNAYFTGYKAFGIYLYNRGNVYVKGSAWEERVIRKGEGRVFRLRN